MKLKFTFFILLFIIISLFSCETSSTNSNEINNSISDSDKIALDKQQLEISYAGNDNSSNVTQNIVLPSVGSNGSIISWMSNDPTIITKEGIVTRPEYGSGNAVTILTATITLGTVQEKKLFVLSVMENPPNDEQAVFADKESLIITFASGDDSDNVTKNITLLSMGSCGSSITWESSDLTLLSHDGIVTRPSYGTGNIQVTITATLSKGIATDIKVFNVTIIEAPINDIQAVASDKSALEIIFADGDNASSITQNISLPVTGNSDSVISWQSNFPLTISNNGIVFRPSFQSGDMHVVLTATISKGTVSDTKEFNVIVIKLPMNNSDIVAADKAALELTFAEGDDASNVTQNITLPVTGDNGSMISWYSSAPISFSNSGIVTRPTYGHGNILVYLTATIAKNAASDTKVFPLTIIEAPQTDEQAVIADRDSLQIVFADGNSASNVTQNITLAVSGNSGTTISWSSNYPSIISTNGVVSRPVYGSGNMSVFLTATIVKGSSSMTKSFNVTVIEMPETDEEAVAADKTALVIIYANGDNITNVTQNITLPIIGGSGSTISWSSSNESIISSSGTVNRPEPLTGNQQVVLTATIEKGTIQDVKLFTLTVIEEPHYIVTYHVGTGNTSGDVPVDSNIYTTTQAVNVLNNTGNLTGPEIQNGVRQRFLHWNTQPDGSGKSYRWCDSFNIVNSDIMLYAIYTSDVGMYGKIGPAGGFTIEFRASGLAGEGFDGFYYEVTPDDISTGAEWGCKGVNISGANGTTISDSLQNTIDIESGCTTSGTAADLCSNLTYGGYSNWSLPSKDAFNYIYDYYMKSISGSYWTSNKYNTDPDYAYSFDFTFNGYSPDEKDALYNKVICIRDFQGNYPPLP